MPDYQAIMTSPIGKLGIQTNETSLTKIDFLPIETAEHAPETGIAHEVITALNAYFTNPKILFELPLEPCATEFQHKVLQALIAIPPGKVTHYGEIAKKLNSNARAVGNACRSNPIPIIIPCHRVIAKNNLGGYFGETEGEKMNIKTYLLNHEGVKIDFSK